MEQLSTEKALTINDMLGKLYGVRILSQECYSKHQDIIDLEKKQEMWEDGHKEFSENVQNLINQYKIYDKVLEISPIIIPSDIARIWDLGINSGRREYPNTKVDMCGSFYKVANLLQTYNNMYEEWQKREQQIESITNYKVLVKKRTRNNENTKKMLAPVKVALVREYEQWCRLERVEVKKEIEALEKKIVDHYNQLQKDIENVIAPNLKEANKKYEIILSTTEQFCVQEVDFIHYSDCAEFDYLIYLFETKRASSVKEALQLLDEQRRSDRLLNTISQCSETICTGIRYGLGAIEHELFMSTNAISNMVKSQSKRFSDAVDSLGNKVSEYSVSQAELNRKLTDSINTNAIALRKEIQNANIKITIK